MRKMSNVENPKTKHARLWAKMWIDFKARGLEPEFLWNEAGELEGRDPNFRARLLTLPIHKGKNRGMFIVCAGGAFVLKAAHEAGPVAEYFHKKGFNAAILDYTVSWKDDGDIFAGGRDYAMAAALQDAQRAIRTLRHKAGELGFPKNKIAIGGFSAGGMLSGMAATLYDDGDLAAADPIERESSRPDAALILYGAMTFSAIRDMSYDAAKQNLRTRFDNILNLHAKCPPFFIFQTHEDDPRFAMNFGKALADYGIPFEVHTFANGGHGGGLFDGGGDDSPLEPHTARWAELAAEWLEELKF